MHKNLSLKPLLIAIAATGALNFTVISFAMAGVLESGNSTAPDKPDKKYLLRTVSDDRPVNIGEVNDKTN